MAYSRIGISFYCVVLLRCMLYEANSTTLALGEGDACFETYGMFRNTRPPLKYDPRPINPITH